MELSLELLALLFATAVAAGFVDTLAGGGGLITLPALLLTGMPPVQALATNKLQSSFGTLTASVTLLRQGLLSWRALRLPFCCAFMGSALGAGSVQFIDPAALDVVIPLVLGGIALYFLLAPKAGEMDTRPRIGPRAYHTLVVPLIGYYDGMFGPGTGSFFSSAGVALRGQNLVTATLHAKALNFATNLAALVVFAVGGQMAWSVGAVMIAGQILGALLGTRAVVRGGARLIRPVLVLVCMVMLGRYFWDKGMALV